MSPPPSPPPSVGRWSRPSLWWAGPAEPDKHFSDSALMASEAHHGPMRRVGLAGLVAKMLLLAAAALLVGRSGRQRGAAELWRSSEQWPELVVSGRVLAGTALAVVALRLPAVVVDGWFEFAFRRGRPDYRPVPVIWFVGTTSALAALSMVVGVPVVAVAYRYGLTISWWPLLLASLVVLATASWAVVERGTRRLLGVAERPIEADGAQGRELAELAQRFGLVELSFVAVGPVPRPENTVPDPDGPRPEDTEPDAAVGPGPHPHNTAAGPDVAGQRPEYQVPNAFSIGLGSNRRVAVTEALLAQPKPVRDFVVAHELTHLAKGHLRHQTVVALVVYVVAIATIGLLSATGQPWNWFGFDVDDPLGLPVMVLVVIAVLGLLGPLTAWPARVHERMADAGAVAAVGPLSAASAEGLFLATESDLRPPWWARLYSAHPAPAERLEFLARHRRAVADRWPPDGPGPAADIASATETA